VQKDLDPHSSENRQWYASQLDGIGPHASQKQNERFDLAVAYLETHCKKTGSDGKEVVIDRAQVLQQLNSIDFHKPVELVEIEPGKNLLQYSDGERGQYFTDPGVPQQKLGITVKARAADEYTVKEKMIVLKTHTRETIDTWSNNRSTSYPLTSERLEQTGAKVESKVVNKESGTNLKPTNNAKLRRRTYRKNTEADGKDQIVQRSGEYASAGGCQYHIPKMKDQNLQHKCRHQNLVKTRKHKISR